MFDHGTSTVTHIVTDLLPGNMMSGGWMFLFVYVV